MIENACNDVPSWPGLVTWGLIKTCARAQIQKTLGNPWEGFSDLIPKFYNVRVEIAMSGSLKLTVNFSG